MRLRTAITTGRLITIPRLELTAGNRPSTGPTVRPRAQLATILTLARTPAALQCRLLMEVGVPHRHTILTPERMRKRGRARALRRSGVVPMFPAAESVARWGITQTLTEPLLE